MNRNGQSLKIINPVVLLSWLYHGEDFSIRGGQVRWIRNAPFKWRSIHWSDIFAYQFQSFVSGSNKHTQVSSAVIIRSTKSRSSRRNRLRNFRKVATRFSYVLYLKKNKESNERWPFSCLVSPRERAARYRNFILYHHKYNESSRVCPCSRCPLPSLLTSYATMTATTPASSFIFSAVFDSTMPLKNVCPGHGFSCQWFLHHCIGFRQKNSQVTKNNDCKQTHSVITSKS